MSKVDFYVEKFDFLTNVLSFFSLKFTNNSALKKGLSMTIKRSAKNLKDFTLGLK